MTKVIAVVLLLLLTVVMVAILSDFSIAWLTDIITAIEDIGIIERIKAVLP